MLAQDYVLSHVIDYLKLKCPDFKCETRGKQIRCTCPVCKLDQISANTIKNSNSLFCQFCGKNVGDLFTFVKILEEDKAQWSDEAILVYVRDLLKLPVDLPNEVSRIFEAYARFGFDIIPIVRDEKIPIEKEWTTKERRDKARWLEWIEDTLNVGVKTGKCSNLTIIDIDTQEVPEVLKNCKTLIQKSTKGYHYFFQYEEDIPVTRIDELKIDILNNGKQCVIHPSVVNGDKRTLNMTAQEMLEYDIPKMPKEVKEFIQNKITMPGLKAFSERVKEDLALGEFNLELVGEGSRNTFLIHLGGMLRKELNKEQVGLVVNLTNRHFLKPPLPQKEIDNLINQLDKYTVFDEQEIAVKILNYMKIVEESNSRDIREALGEMGAEGKQRVEKAISYLVKEGFIIKKRRIYHLIKKATWKDTWIDEDTKIDFNMPYFDNYAVFRDGDLIVIGAKTGAGKTHLAMNMVKQLAEQGKKPYYISLESGSRFLKIAKELGMKEADFKWCIHFSPEDVELEKRAITIIDWVLPDDYANTDKLYKRFAEQLVKQGGTLIVFAQLMQNGEFFAKNMIDLFPSFVTKFLYTDEEGINSEFVITKIREPKTKIKSYRIPCIYNFEDKTLKPVTDQETFKIPESINLDPTPVDGTILGVI